MESARLDSTRWACQKAEQVTICKKYSIQNGVHQIRAHTQPQCRSLPIYNIFMLNQSYRVKQIFGSNLYFHLGNPRNGVIVTCLRPQLLGPCLRVFQDSDGWPGPKGINPHVLYPILPLTSLNLL